MNITEYRIVLKVAAGGKRVGEKGRRLNVGQLVGHGWYVYATVSMPDVERHAKVTGH